VVSASPRRQFAGEPPSPTVLGSGDGLCPDGGWHLELRRCGCPPPAATTPSAC